MSLFYIVENFIESQKEGAYWDFKSEPYANNAALLHDILCLANAPHKGDRYLIIGVSDSSKGCKIVGLTAQQAGRKTQAQYIYFLNSQKFVRERPTITLQTLHFNDEAGIQKEIDVIIIKNLPEKPYYLNEDYKDKDKIVRAFYIYSRTNDTNTAINKAADFHLIEKMWLQRWGLDLTPSERFVLLLNKPEDWVKLESMNNFYHKRFSEFRIELGEPSYEDEKEAFFYFFPNPTGDYGKVLFKYFGAPIFEELSYFLCHEYRKIIAKPKLHCFNLVDRLYYYYYNLEDLDGRLLNFLQRKNNIDFSSPGEELTPPPFIVFNNQAEKEVFDIFLKEKEENLPNIDNNTIPHYQFYKYDENFSMNFPFFYQAKKMFDIWKRQPK